MSPDAVANAAYELEPSEQQLLPAGWVWARIDDLAEINSGITPKAAEEQASVSGEIPWFKVSSMNSPGNEVQMHHSEWWFGRAQAEKMGFKIIKSGSLIFPN
jgi:type I restriction enzyme S subunit